jgi:2,3-bisphosphoglycerate-dependent phosphoglycerate mutase
MKTPKFFILIALFLAVSCSSGDDPQIFIQPQPVKTVVYLIRHAEKADLGANPNLSAAGMQRAQNWATLLQDVPFEAFYSTSFNRTLQTIQPIADDNGKEVTIYDPADFSLEDVVASHHGKNVFIVGHSNTIPQLINAYLGEDIYPDMAETEFGNLYKITVQGETVSHEMTVHN